MKIIYDKTYTGYLNALEKALKENTLEISSFEENNLFDFNFHTKTDYDKAKNLEFKIKSISCQALKKIQLLYLSEIKDFENIALDYLKNIFKYGKEAENNLSDISISKTNKISKKVLSQAHKFKGFIRFKEIEKGLMFSEIEPEYNILPLIKNHFRIRFGNLNFIIYDSKRKKAIINTKNRCQIIDISDIKFQVTKNEKEISQLWKKFFSSIEIKERSNPDLQKSKVPLKYRKNITEFE